MSLPTQFLDELRARTTLSTLIGKTVKLQKAGREYRACCPFHNEKTPSFYVNDEKGFYHCFGCSAHGDAIQFLTDNRGLQFMDAVKELAAAAGMDVPAPDPRAQERAERASGLHDVMAAAARWFEEQLAGIEGAAARDYLKKRGIDDRQRRDFSIGYAPDSRGKLKAALKDFGIEALIEAGLLISVEEKEPYDRFRGRLMIPIRDARGRVIAFGGRIIGEGEPKYLNSPDTPLFDKGRTLFNLDKASAAARKAGRVIVVEGYMDVIGLDRVGLGEAVAPLGTALTEGQLERLWKMADAPLLCFDGDSAGQKAAIRAALRALPLISPGRSLSFVTLPAGQDPDDLAKSGGRAAIDTLLEAPQALADRLWDHLLSAEPIDTPEQRAGLRRRLDETVGTIGDPIVRDQYRIEYRNRFDALFAQRRQSSSPWASRRNDRGFRGDRRPWGIPDRPVSASARSIGQGGIDHMMARAIISGLIRYPDMIEAHAETIGILPLADPTLSSVRNILIEAAFNHAPLEHAQAISILEKAGQKVALEDILGPNGLAFSFMRSNSDSERARRDLGEVIELLATRPALDRSLAEATKRFETETDDQAFAEQQRLSQARREAEQRLMALAGDDDGAGL